MWSALSAEQQDYLLCDVVLDGRDAEEPIQFFADLLAAAQKNYAGTRTYKAAWAVFGGWKSQQPVHHAPPMPSEIAFGGAALALALQLSGIAVTLVIGFCCGLRISETLALLYSDVVFHSGTCIVLIRFSKCGLPHSERVVLTNPRVVRWLYIFMHSWFPAKPSAKVCRTTYFEFASFLRQLSSFLECSEPFTSHSLRRGCATEMWLKGVSINDICLFCRWASVRSAQLYVKTGEVQLIRSRQSRSKRASQRMDIMVKCFGAF